MDVEKVFDDLIAALDEMWRERMKIYNRHRSDYVRGQLNIISRIEGAITLAESKSDRQKTYGNGWQY